MRNPDRIGALVLLAVAAIFWSQMGSIVTFMGYTFPRLVLWPLTILALMLLVKSWVRPDPPAPFFEESPGPMAVVLVTVAIWIFLLERLGFASSTTLAYAFLAWYLGGRPRELRRIAINLVIIAAEVALVYWVFNDLLLVPLPEGLLI